MDSTAVAGRFSGPGSGNLSAVIASGNDGSSHFGLAGGVRLVTELIAYPPAWLRPSFHDDPPLLLFSHLIAPFTALALLSGLALVATWCIVRARGPGIDATAPSMTVLLIAVMLSILTTSLLPQDLFGGGAHKYRYLWALGAFS